MTFGASESNMVYEGSDCLCEIPHKLSVFSGYKFSIHNPIVSTHQLQLLAVTVPFNP